jgi:ribosomal protein S7
MIANNTGLDDKTDKIIFFVSGVFANLINRIVLTIEKTIAINIIKSALKFPYI